MSGTFPVVITEEGVVPTPPQALRDALVAIAVAESPGLTANLPGSLIEDLASTGTGGLVLIDSFRVELLNSLDPRTANAFLLRQLGAIYGVPLGLGSTTSVSVVFSGDPGYVIAQGFTVSDGTYHYIAQHGAVIGEAGTSSAVFCLAVLQGSWVVPENTVNQLVTSIPATVTLSVNNPLAGTPGGGAQTQEEYRAQVLQAGISISQGMATTLRTKLELVSGVQPRLISTRQVSGGGWEIIVGGGDPYEVAYAIFYALFDISTLVGSTLVATDITQANPGVVTTNQNHNYITGQVIEITGVVGMVEINDMDLTITVIDATSFSVGIDTTGFTAYVSGGTITPNLRNETIDLIQYPDIYAITFVRPPAQTVTISLTWNTTATNVVSPTAIAQLGAPALADYINQLPVGVPINLFELETTFQVAIASAIPPQLLTRMIFAVAIDGTSVPPISGTGIIAGDPESYFQISTTDITIAQG